jgi:ApeA N-terminal domain 1
MMAGMFVGDLPGRWWLPGREEHAAAGTLHIAWNERPRVTAIGFLEPASVETLFRLVQDRFIQHPVVLGRGADGQLVTLADVRVEIRQAHADAPGDASTELVAWHAYRGIHIASEAIGFNGAQLQLEHLLDFLGRDWIPEERVLEGGRLREAKLAMVRDVPTVVGFPGGTVSLGLDVSLTGDRSHERGISRAARAIVELDTPVPPLEWMSTFVTPFTYLLNLVTGNPIAIETMSLVGPTGGAGDAMAEFLWDREPPAARLDGPLLPRELLFTATTTPVPLARVLERWLRAWAELRPILELFFATRGRTQLFEEHRLLNLTQALEAFHRVRIGGNPIDPDIHADRVHRAIAGLVALPVKDRKWAGSALKRANEFTLADRIAALVLGHDWMLGDVIKVTARQFGEHVALTRNYHTHWDERRDAAVGSDLWPLNEQLMILGEACLLGEIGFDEDATSEAVRRASGAYRALKLNGY